MANTNYLIYTKMYADIPMYYIQLNDEQRMYTFLIGDAEMTVLFRSEKQAQMFREEIDLGLNTIILSRKFGIDYKGIVVINTGGFIQQIKQLLSEDKSVYLKEFYQTKLSKAISTLEQASTDLATFYRLPQESGSTSELEAIQGRIMDAQNKITKLKQEFNSILEA